MLRPLPSTGSRLGSGNRGSAGEWLERLNLESERVKGLAHIKVFGQEMGSMLVGDALGDRGDSEFIRGRTAGAGDLTRWLDDRAYTPLSLTDYLHADDKSQLS
jgi:hypothetical protein